MKINFPHEKSVLDIFMQKYYKLYLQAGAAVDCCAARLCGLSLFLDCSGQAKPVLSWPGMNWPRCSALW